MGLWPCPAPTGYLKENRLDRKCQTYIDPDRGHIIKQMFEKVAYDKWSGLKVYHWLKFDMNFKTAKGHKNLTLGNIHLLLKSTFYYGEFEYPRKSGNWYKGIHKPLITKELFNLVQSQLTRQVSRTEFNSKEFAFTKLMTCGLCGSGITADEKFKHQQNGNIHRYVYYACSKSKDKSCKCGYTNEDDLLKQFLELLDKIDLDEIGMKVKIQVEIEKIKGFQRSVLGTKGDIKVKDVDIRNYAKYILKDGSDIQKRELLGCLKSKIKLANKVITIS
jgi:site-specific DNA recombinase